MDNMGASSRDSSNVNELIKFWINEGESKDTPEKNEDDSDILRESYCNGDANQIPTIVLSLEKMSSVSIAIGLWNHATTLFPELEPDKAEWRRSLFSQVPEWVSHLNLPGLLAKYVLDHFIDIVLQVRQWVNYHLSEVFRNELNRSSLYQCMLRISWHPNGAINYAQTAQNLLKSEDVLRNVEKYRLACMYCLKHQIAYLYMMLIGHPVARVDVFYVQSRFSLTDYWNCYYADRLSRVPTPAYPRYSVDEFMIRRSDVKNWSSIEFFFDRMSPETQISSAIYFIDAGNVEIQHMILGKMNEAQRLTIYSEKAARIIENYACKGGVDLNEPNAISTWYELRDLITQDQFADLLKRLCKANVPNSVLIEIWISAKVEFKRHIFNINNFDFIAEVLRWSCEKRDLGIDFLFAVLEVGTKFAAKPPTKWTFSRKFFFKRLCEKLVFKKEFDLINGLLDWCVPDANACGKIKRILAEKMFISANGKKLLIEAEFRKLVQFLKYFYPSKIDRSLVLETCKRLIKKAEFENLELLLNFLYPPNVPESKQIVRDLLVESLECIDLLSHVLFWGENLKELNLPAPLQPSCPEIILQFKTFLLFSKLSIEVFSSQFILTPGILKEMLSRCFPHDRFIAQLVRMIIFSDEGVLKLHKLLCDKNFPHEAVKNQISPFFQSHRYKRKLRAKLISTFKYEELRADPKAKEKYLQVLCACDL